LQNSTTPTGTKRLVRVFFALAGAIVLLATFAWVISIFGFVSDAEIVEGTVSQLNAGGSHPEITFSTRDGKSIKSPQGGLIFGYRVGDQVSIYYDPKEPKRATLKSFGALCGFPLLAGTLGIFFLGVGLFSRSDN
jgi:hypothetical protein